MQVSNGFSIIEVIMVIAIMAIVLAMLVPSQKNYFQSTTAILAGDELYQALQIARNEAVMRGKTVTVCESQDEQSCSGEWKNGFIVKAEQKILYSHHYSLSDGQIFWRAFPRESHDLVFLPTGFSEAQNGTFWFCLQDKKDPSWAIVLNQSGRVRKVVPDRAGHIYDDNENLLLC